MSLRLIAGVCLFALATALGHPASAEPPVPIRWRAPASCSSERAMNAEVARILGPPVEGDAPRKAVSADATIEESPRGWGATLTLHVEGTTTMRRFSGTSCREITAATALIVALAIDARAQPPPPESPPPPPPDDAPEPPAPPPEPAPRPRVVNGRPWHLSAIGGAVLDTATLPGVTVGPNVGVSLGWAPVRIELEAAILVSRATAGGEFSSRTLGGRGCLELARGPLSLGPCVGSRLVVVSADGRGTASSVERDAAWADLGLDGLARLMLGPLAIRGTIGGHAPLRRPSFVLRQPAPPDLVVHRAASLTFFASLGVELVFL